MKGKRKDAKRRQRLMDDIQDILEVASMDELLQIERYILTLKQL